jgi:ABC-type glycerol-3-phosphate transport system substrate-binding protein
MERFMSHLSYCDAMPRQGNTDVNGLNRRKYLFLASGALAVTAGCSAQTDGGDSGSGDNGSGNGSSGNNSSSGNGSSGNTQITYYDRYEWCEEYSTEYNSEGDDYAVETQVNPTTSGGAYQSAISQISAGEAPEVIGLDVVQIANFAELGALGISVRSRRI